MILFEMTGESWCFIDLDNLKFLLVAFPDSENSLFIDCNILASHAFMKMSFHLRDLPADYVTYLFPSAHTYIYLSLLVIPEETTQGCVFENGIMKFCVHEAL